MQIKHFNKTRWYLAFWCALIMALILGLCGLIVYQIMIHNLESIDLELESITGTLHSVIEPSLKQPRRIEPVFKLVLPNLCVIDSGCSNQYITSNIQLAHNRHGIFSEIYKDKQYYVRFVDTSLNLQEMTLGCSCFIAEYLSTMRQKFISSGCTNPIETVEKSSYRFKISS